MVKIAETLFVLLFFLQITRDFSFLDYILGGCQLMFTVRAFDSDMSVMVKTGEGGSAGGLAPA